MKNYLPDYINYIFSGFYPENYDEYLLKEKIFTYSEVKIDSYSTENSDGPSSYDYYYYYYFEFTKPNTLFHGPSDCLKSWF